MSLLVFAPNVGCGYFIESRFNANSPRFSAPTPPDLVIEKVKQPDKCTMKATNREMTVLVCDRRGFTSKSEKMEPQELQALLNVVFSRFTRIIRNRCTIDKYIGDCVIAFWEDSM